MTTNSLVPFRSFPCSLAGVKTRPQCFKGLWYHRRKESAIGRCLQQYLVSFFCLSEHNKLNPFRTAVPFWGQLTYNLSELSPKRDCGSSMYVSVNHGARRRGKRCGRYVRKHVVGEEETTAWKKATPRLPHAPPGEKVVAVMNNTRPVVLPHKGWW